MNINAMKEFVQRLLIDTSSKFKFDCEEVIPEKKISYVLRSRKNMVSIEILPDFTCDFFLIEIESEEMLYCETNKYKSLDELKIGIRDMIKKSESLKLS